MPAAENEQVFKMHRVPKAVAREMRAAAAKREISARRAFRAIFAACESNLAETIAAGRAVEASMRGGQTVALQFHLPKREHAALKRRAASLGESMSDLGLYVLLARRGDLDVAIVQGLAAPVHGVEMTRTAPEGSPPA